MSLLEHGPMLIGAEGEPFDSPDYPQAYAAVVSDFVQDPKANAIGFGMLANTQLRKLIPQDGGGEFLAQG